MGHNAHQGTARREGNASRGAVPLVGGCGNTAKLGRCGPDHQFDQQVERHDEKNRGDDSHHDKSARGTAGEIPFPVFLALHAKAGRQNATNDLKQVRSSRLFRCLVFVHGCKILRYQDPEDT